MFNKERFLVGKVLLERSHKGALLLGSLETAMTKLAGSVDELEGNLLEGSTAGVGHQRLAEGEDTLLGTNASALDHHKVLVDDTVMVEASHGGYGLLGQVKLGRSRVLVSTVGHAIDLLVHLRAAMETVLTGAGNGESNAGRMPGTNTSDLTETLVGLARKLASAPAGSDTLESVTLGNTNDVNVLVLLEDGADGDLLLKVAVGPVDLVGNGTTVQLDFHNVGLLLTNAQLTHLSVSNDADDGGVLAELLKSSLNVRSAILVFKGVLGKGVLLAAVPVLVETAASIVAEVLSPQSGHGAQTTGSGDVASNTNDNHGRSLDDGNGFEDLLLVHLGSGAVQVADDVGHTGLVAHKGGQMHGLGGIVSGEGLDAGANGNGTLAGQETQGTMAGSAELAVRLHRV